MLESSLPGLKEPENLTGQVIVDKDEEEFRGNYSTVYLGRYRNEIVSGLVMVVQYCIKVTGLYQKGGGKNHSEDWQSRIHETGEAVPNHVRRSFD
jgi:hypothetical protein